MPHQLTHVTRLAPAAFTTETVIAAQGILLAAAAPKRGQIDLRGKRGAWLSIGIGRISTVAYTNRIEILISRLFGTIMGVAGSLRGTHHSEYQRMLSGLAASGTITGRLNGAAAAGAMTLACDGDLTGIVATNDARIALFGAAPGAVADGADPLRLEFARVAKSAASPLNLVNPLAIVHDDNDYLTSAAEMLEVYLDGGFVYDLAIDANNIAAGVGCVVQAVAQVAPWVDVT